ncbi:MAG: hypothetical protein CMJ18_09615 [Phycisphaeraceae bacterium]|nr:hypothetical protein [Phycisphaeraceae bacterium]
MGEAESESIGAIVVPVEPDPAERHAANELVRTIRRMTGRSLPVVSEAAARDQVRSIVLGRTRDNLSRHHPDDWPLDTIYIGYGEGDIAIIGQGEQGTLFAAFEFLRDQGCRWYMPMVSHEEEVGECIPKRQRLDLSDQPQKHTPSFQDRGWHATPVGSPALSVQFKDWAVRNGVNALTTGDTAIYYPALLGYGRQKQTGHTLRWFVPSGNHPSEIDKVKATFAAHPERYPVVNGERTWMYRDGRQVQVCLSNPDVARIAARDMIRYFRDGYGHVKDPRWWLFSIGHNDEPSYWCECASCLAMDGPGSTWKANDTYDAYPDAPQCRNGPGALSDRYVRFVNQVARLVAKELPDRFVSFYAYGSTVAPPRDQDLVLEDNVIVEFAYSGHCLRHDFDDPDCPYNTNLVTWVRDWTRRGRLLYYDYPPTGRHINIPTGYYAHYRKLLRFLKSCGVVGLSGESQGTWAGSALFHQVKARLLWDIDADVDRIIHEFCRDMYGAAAATMERYHRTYEARLMAYSGHMVWGNWVAEFDGAHLRALQKLLDEAKRQAAAPVVGKRIEMVQASLNAFALTQLEELDVRRIDAESFDRYRMLKAGTLKIMKDLDLPIPLVVTGPYKDRLKRGSYRPPFEAIRGEERSKLPLVWRFRTDPDDAGLKQGWDAKPATDGPGWRDIRVDDYWTSQGVSHHGAAWYATTFAVPDGVTDDLWLLFPMIDGDAEIWIDGRSAGRLAGDPWDKPKAVALSDAMKTAGEHQLVVRVYKDRFAAGLNGLVRLMESYRIIGDR